MNPAKNNGHIIDNTPRAKTEIRHEDINRWEDMIEDAKVDDVFITPHTNRQVGDKVIHTMFRIVSFSQSFIKNLDGSDGAIDYLQVTHAYRDIAKIGVVTVLKTVIEDEKWKRIGTWNGKDVELLAKEIIITDALSEE